MLKRELVDQTVSDPALLCSAVRHLQVPCGTSRFASCPVAKHVCAFGVVLIREANNASESFVVHSVLLLKTKVTNKSTVQPIVPHLGTVALNCFKGGLRVAIIKIILNLHLFDFVLDLHLASMLLRSQSAF